MRLFCSSEGHRASYHGASNLRLGTPQTRVDDLILELWVAKTASSTTIDWHGFAIKMRELCWPFSGPF